MIKIESHKAMEWCRCDNCQKKNVYYIYLKDKKTGNETSALMTLCLKCLQSLQNQASKVISRETRLTSGKPVKACQRQADEDNERHLILEGKL